jgi:hypothetical protein
LKAGLWVRRARLAIVAPDMRHSRRSQADLPLIDLSEFGQPPLSASVAMATSYRPAPQRCRMVFGYERSSPRAERISCRLALVRVPSRLATQVQCRDLTSDGPTLGLPSQRSSISFAVALAEIQLVNPAWKSDCVKEGSSKISKAFITIICPPHWAGI